MSVQGSVSAAPRLDVDEARRQVEALYHKAEQATERYNEARMALQDAERKFGRAQKLASAQQSTVSELQKTVGAFAANAYRSGGMDQTLQLVFSDDPEAFIAKAASLDALSSREAGALRKVVEARRELQANQTAAAQQLAVVEAQRKALAGEKSEVEKNLRAAREVLNRLQAKDRGQLNRASRGDDRDLLKNLPLPNPRAAKAIEYALGQLGDRYVWGADGPDGFDCSGLTMAAWGKAGVSLPHSSAQQYSSGDKIPRSELQPGDLVYFYSPISHVGMYLGNGRMVHAPNPSRRVEIAPIAQMPYTGATRP
ncbi:C40 family peptidase [Sporichthya sp.]|uniref:C40 family peptidase n=1 Tax=Sporichthya sp. TaxID=65475 RepID=UPI0025DAC7BB|nr:C40 family peptidase [Sporichthya sp.]